MSVQNRAPVRTPAHAGASTTADIRRSPLRPVTLACLLTLAASAGTGLMPGSASIAHAQAPALLEINLPSQPLEASLHALARQSGRAIAVDAQLVAGKTSPAVRGRFTLGQALGQLLAQSGLNAREEAGSVVLHRVGAVPGATLAEVKVSARGGSAADELTPAYAGGQVARGGRLGVLGNVDLMDAPFAVTAYTSEFIADQQAGTIAGVLRSDPSVRFTTSDGHNAENFTIRGFEVNSSEIALNGLYGLLPGAHVPTEFLERVEIFKGPSAMLSGLSPIGSIGGVINLVPKRAGDVPLTRLTTGFSSSSRFGTAIDVARRVGDEQRLGIRFNGSASSGETELDDQKKRERFASLGLDYRGRGWKAELDAYYSEQNQDNGSPLMVGFSTLGRVLKAPEASSNALRGTYARQDTRGFAVRGEYQLNDRWTAYAAAGAADYDYDGYINGTRVVVLNANGSSRGQTYNQTGYTHGTSAEAGFRGTVRTGEVAHQLVLSASALEIRNGLAPAVTSASYTTNIYSPIANPTLAGPHSAAVQSADNTSTSIGLIDTMHLLDDRLQLVLGLRAQRVRQSMATPRAYDETAVTPALGVVYKPWGPSISLYGNYIEGLSAGQTVGVTYANSGDTLAPFKTKQVEAGVKWDAGSFGNTLSVFQIEKPSAIATTAAGAALATLSQEGEQRNRGVEWTTFGQVTPQVRLIGGAAYTRAVQTRATTTVLDGLAVAGVPRWTANLGADWALPWVPGLALNTRAVHTGAQYLDTANTLEIPSWTRVDIGARYSTRMAGKAVVLRASVENVADRNYWSGRFGDGFATLGSARTVRLSASVDF